MNLSFHDWQDGYSAAATNIRMNRIRMGWARAKGDAKRIIRAFASSPPRSEFGNGFVDAYLDSVGC